MELERAKEIVAAINSFCFAGMSRRDADLATLKEVSLKEMIEANDVVCAENDRARTWAKENGGGYSAMTHPDPRLIAAVYTFLNYSPSDRDDDEEDNLILRVDLPGNRVQFLIAGIRTVNPPEDENDVQEAA